MKLIIISIFFAVNAFEFFLKFLNYKNRKVPLPNNVSDVYDAETYSRQKSYEMDNLKVSIFSGICSLFTTTAYLIFDFHSLLFNYIVNITSNVYLQTWFMLGAVMAIFIMVNTVFDAYKTFKIEAKYGFNKATLKTFIGDIIKQILINVIVFGGLISLFMLLYFALGDNVFVLFYGIAAIFIIILLLFTRQFSKLFNKFKPLDDGELKDRINAFAQTAGFPVKNIFVMNGSKRSTKASAYFTGFGKSRSIVLYDTLIEKLDADEIVAVLAHEAGHSKKKHMLGYLVMNLLSIAAIIVFAQFVVTNLDISKAFGFADVNIGFGIYILFIAYAPVSVLLNIPVSYIQRCFEYAADKYAAQSTNRQHIITALKKTVRINYLNLTPHPFVVAVEYSHPTLSQRIERIESLENDVK